MPDRSSRATILGIAATLAGQVSGNLGAAFAKQLFPWSAPGVPRCCG
jgi:inner membrane transporter RhtA